MKQNNAMFSEIASAARSGNFNRWILFSFILVLIGASAFLFGVMDAHPERAWRAYLVNFVFWTGIACASIMFSATLVLSKAIWGRSLKRLAEAPGAFLPVAFILFWILFIGREHLFHWIHEPLPKKEIWLNVPAFFTREGIIILLLSISGMFLIYHSIRPDLEALTLGALPEPAKEDLGRHGRRQMIYANIFGLLFAFLLSILAFDLIMSLSPHWYSTLFGAYYLIGSFFSALAILMIMTSIAFKTEALGKFILKKQLHNLGKLMMGFCLMTADFFYVQFFVIWSGNLPEETRYIIERTYLQPWKNLAWIVLLTAFVIPFIILIIRQIKMMPRFMIGLSSVILCGMWLEKFLLIAPSGSNSTSDAGSILFGWLEILITTGFIGLMGLCILFFLKFFPQLPIGDPMFIKNIEPIYPAGFEKNG